MPVELSDEIKARLVPTQKAAAPEPTPSIVGQRLPDEVQRRLVPVEPRRQHVFRESTGTVVDAPYGLTSDQIEYFDDTENIDTIGKVRGSFVKGSIDTVLNQLETKSMFTKLSDDDVNRYWELMNRPEAKQTYKADGTLEEALTLTAQTLPQLQQQLLGAGIGAGAGAGVGAAVGATGAGVGALPGAVTGAGFGGTIGSAYKSFEQQAGAISRDMKTIRGVNGETLDPNVIKGAAAVAGIANAGLDILPLGAIAHNIPGFDQVAGVVFKPVVKALEKIPGFEKIAAPFTREGMKELVKLPGAQKILFNFGKRLTELTTAEVGTEMAQQGIQIAATEKAKEMSGGEFVPISFQEGVEQVQEAGRQALLVSGAIGTGLATANVPVDIANQNAQTADIPAAPAAPIEEAPAETAAAPEVAEVDAEQAAVDTAVATPIAGLDEKESSTIIKDYIDGKEIKLDNYDEAQKVAIQDVMERTRPVREKMIAARVRKLDSDIEVVLDRLDAVEQELELARADGKGTKRLEARAEKLAREWENMDQERGELMTVEDARAESADLLGKEVTVKGADLEKMDSVTTKEAIRATNTAFRKARSATKKDIKTMQKALTGAIRKSGLTNAEQAAFISSITNIQSKEQLEAQIPKIQQRIENKLAKRHRKEVVTGIKKKLAQARKSNVIAVDFVNKIEDLVSDIDLSRRSQGAIDALNATLEFAKRGGLASLPTNVINKLEILNKKRIEDVSTADLEDISNEVSKLISQGKTKLKLMEAQKKRRQATRLEELTQDSVALSNRPFRDAPLGERISVVDEARNKLTGGINRLQRLNINKNPMDVIFDIMDGNKDYKGANFKIFKKTIDEGFGKFLNLRDSTTRAVKDLADKHKFKKENFDRIGVYAALQQEGGAEKLRESGITSMEIEALKLTDAELEMYDLMRQKLDTLKPAIREIMRVVYNKDFEEVKNYFPFMTDFEAMQDLEIQDMFGDNVPLIINQKNVERGFTKGRKLGRQKIRIDAMNVFLKHVENAAYLIDLGQHIKELGELAGTEDFGNIAGDFGQQLVVDWINLLARKGRAQGRIGILDTLRKNVGAAAQAFKITSALIQPLSLMDGAALVGGGYVMNGAVSFAVSPEWRKFLFENFPEVRDRVGDDPNYMDMGGTDPIGVAREFGFYALKNLDLLSASSVAIGAYKKAMDAKGMEVDFNNPDPDAIAEAQLMMRRTQSSAFAKDSAPIISQGKLTGNVSLDRLILQFQSFLLNRWSVIQHDLWNIGIMEGKTKQAANIIFWLSLANFTEMMMRHQPDDDELGEKMIMQLIGNIPFVGSIVNSLTYGSVPVPSISMVQQVAKSTSTAARTKNSEKKADHTLDATILGLGILGLPGAVQIKQGVQALREDD